MAVPLVQTSLAESSPHSEFRSRFACPKHKKKKELIVKDKCFIPLPNR